MYTVASPGPDPDPDPDPDHDPNPRGRGQLPNPNKCNSTPMKDGATGYQFSTCAVKYP